MNRWVRSPQSRSDTLPYQCAFQTKHIGSLLFGVQRHHQRLWRLYYPLLRRLCLSFPIAVPDAPDCTKPQHIRIFSAPPRDPNLTRPGVPHGRARAAHCRARPRRAPRQA
ncbi:MAG: hypothetical protein RML57_05730, partial [Acidobacteriota bacterium]|nr:hypothetical protein [Acidobacteriota bacterium]